MAANYLHGVETVEVESGSRPITVVKAGVIGIIGTSAFADFNTPLLITSIKDADEKLGPAMAEFTLRKHVDLLQKQGGQVTIIAVNVYDEDNHLAAVTNEVCTIVDGKFKLAQQKDPDNNPVVKSFDLVTTYVKDTDYTFDIHGNFVVLNTDLLETNNTQVKVTYDRHSVSLVNEADVIGGLTAGERTGLRVFDLCRSMFGFGPKILLAPVFCETQTMVDELSATANRLRARAIVDGAMDNFDDAIVGRGPLGTHNFNTSNRRVALCFPHRSVKFPFSATAENIGLSTFVAGVWAKQISEKGIQYGPSNVPMIGAGSTTLVLTGDINDPTGEVNLLNEKGIISYMSVYGSEPRTWGNRSAAWPTNTTVDNFLSVLLVADVIDESIEYAMLPYIDLPLNDALITSIKENVNAFLNNLVGRGVVLPGAECIYDPAENPTDELALGHLTFNDKYLPPLPAERITFKRYLATELLANLGQS